MMPLRECSRRRTKRRLPPTHRAVQNRPAVCNFTTELPSIGSANDAFWQQAFDFRSAAYCRVPSLSVSHRVAIKGTAIAAPGCAYHGPVEGYGDGQGPSVKLDLWF
jgi:hypothetical protein